MNLNKLLIILTSDKPSDEIKKNEKEIFEFIPELEVCSGFNQNNPWHIYDVYEHILKVVDGVPNNFVVRLAALFHDIGKPFSYTVDDEGTGHFYGHWNKSLEIFERFADKNNIDSNITQVVGKLILYHDLQIKTLSEDKYNEFLSKFTKDEIKMLFIITRADLLAQNPKYSHLLS